MPLPPVPQPTQKHTRIDLADLKGQIVKKIGADRANRYFNYLNRLLSQKLGKTEFDKSCHLILGRENLPLHNQLIRSILKNAYQGRVPPPMPKKEVLKSVSVIGKKSPKEDGYPLIGGTSGNRFPNLTPLIGTNGDVLPISPRKVRSGVHDQGLRDRPSPLGPNGRANFVSHQLIANEEAMGKGVLENGDLNPCDLQRPLWHHQGLAEQPESEQDASLLPPTKRPRIKKSLDEPISVHSKGEGAITAVEDGEEVERYNSANFSCCPLQAPLGIFTRTLPGASIRTIPSSVDEDELPDNETLRKRMVQIAGAAGLDGVSLDCANLLNNGLDMYLKQLIRSCIQLVGARSRREQIKHSVYKQQPHGKLINGILPGPQMRLQNNKHMEVIQEPKSQCLVSLLDFRVAMELNPLLLGKNWPLLLEKICMHSCGE